MMTPSNDVSFDLTAQRFRALGNELIELMIEATSAERADPVLRSITGPESRALFDEPLPEEGLPMEDVMTIWREKVLPYCRRNGHPRFFAYVCTTADPLGVMADAMASALNQPVTAWRSTPAAAEVERLAVRWLDEFVGFGAGGNGLLVSGGSAANFHGIAAAMTAAGSRAGLPPGSRERLTAYISHEGHLAMRKAFTLVGCPDDHVRMIGVDDRRRMRGDVLAQAIEHDREAGLVPAVVCASSGTANTGAIDPLAELADLCAEHDVWFHIDGAYGAPVAALEEFAWLRDVFARVDSLALDPHKWLFAPVDAGCILVRDDAHLRAAFARDSEYVTVTQTDPIERYAFFDHGMEMSRRFRGLKVWTILKARGRKKISEAIAHDIALRGYLDERIQAESELESLGSELSICCFRYIPHDGAALDELNALNRTIIETLVREGKCYLSATTLDGRLAIRVCIVSFRTTEADIDILVDEVLRLGRVRV